LLRAKGFTNKSNAMTEEPHIGNLIREVLHQQGRSITWLGKQLGCSRQNIKIRKREPRIEIKYMK